MHRVLAELPSQLIGRIVNVPDSFRLHRVVEKRILNALVGNKIRKDHARCPVQLARPVAGSEKLPKNSGQFQRTGAGPGQRHLASRGIEILFFQKHNDFFRRQRVAPGLDTRRFHIARKLRKKIVRIGSRRRKRLGLADGGVDAFFFGGHRINRFAAQLPPDFHARLGEFAPHGVFGHLRKRKRGADSHLGQIVRGGRPDSPDFLYRKITQVLRNLPPPDDGQARRLLMLGGRLGQHFGDAQSHRHGNGQFPLDFFFHPQGDVFIRRFQRPAHAGEIGKRFVDGILFHVGRKAAHHRKQPAGKQAVGFVVRRQDNQTRTHFARIDKRHAALDAQAFGRVACARNNAAFAPGDERLSPKLGMNRLLAGRKKSVAVDVNDGARPGM